MYWRKSAHGSAPTDFPRIATVPRRVWLVKLNLRGKGPRVHMPNPTKEHRIYTPCKPG